MTASVRLRVLPERYAVSRLGGFEPIPAWADGPGFVSISRSAGELSIVCPQHRVPASVISDGGWACLQLVGPFAFDETGIVLSVVRPLSEAELGIFVVSTYDGDFLMLKAADLDQGRRLLVDAGHGFE
ncbi:ACT domain-containing protein [Pseudomonas sp. UBA6310]|uniref:ACT domain-containing protein n=1 Tax=Pseudomonas sp. UBA6310 TaxID=1947327 RepID=UPI00257A7746|nr:ACT domain-containing protein [Pseudomonas sp. UBA6310]